MAKRSLGTLTLDLVAETGGFVKGMDKAERRSKKWRRRVEKDADKVGKAFGVGLAAANGALALMAKNVISNAKEVQNLSAVANTGTGEFQRFTFAAKKYGIEQDKVADILKDTSDKVGDFLQTGGGPLKDFFDGIAPQVGVTADQFRDLSGKDALGLYVKSLEEANISQNEMTFFMEAIASDATLLLPLLRNNGEELEKLGDKAEAAGAVMSELELLQLNEVTKNISEMSMAFDGLKKEVTIGALPAITELTGLLSDEDTVDAAKSLANGIASAFIAATKAIKTTVEVTKFLSEGLAAALNGPAGDDIVRLEDKRDEIQKALSGDASTRIRLLGSVKIDDGIEARLQKQLDGLNKQIDDFYNRPPSSVITDVADIPSVADVIPPVAVGKSNNSKDAPADNVVSNKEFLKRQRERDEQRKQAAKEAEMALRKQQELQENYQHLLRDLRTDEEVLTDQVRERLAVLESVTTISDQQRNETLSRIADDAFMDAPDMATPSSSDDIEESRENLQAWYDEQLSMLDQFRSERADLAATWDEQERMLKKEHEERLTEISNENETLRRQQMMDGYSALLDVAGKYFEGMEGKEAGYTRAAIALGSTLLDEKKRDSLKSILSSTHAAAMGAYQSLAPIPFVGPVLGAVAAGGIYAAGATATASVMGMAHDGIDSVPEDGTWLLQKGERVTTEQTSAKMDRTLDNVNRNLKMVSSMPSRSANNNTTQNIYVSGTPDRKTATQMQREADRRQRITSRRVG